jgi:hypothetical protein
VIALAAGSARVVRQVVCAAPRGRRGTRLVRATDGDRAIERDGKAGPPTADRRAPRRGAFGSWPRASALAPGRHPRSSCLKRCRADPIRMSREDRHPGRRGTRLGTGEAAAKPVWRARIRARDREAENPETPSCEDGARRRVNPLPALAGLGHLRLWDPVARLRHPQMLLRFSTPREAPLGEEDAGV